jgi:transposase
MSRTKRRQFTAAQKAQIVRRHLVDKVPVSELCEEHNLQPSVFYGWRNQLFENASAALEKRGRGRSVEEAALAAERARVAELEAQLATKDHVIAHLAEECVNLKKARGGR